MTLFSMYNYINHLRWERKHDKKRWKTMCILIDMIRKGGKKTECKKPRLEN